MPCTTPCHGHTHRQGRGCECDTQATREALAPLWRRTGHHAFATKCTDGEDADQPLTEPNGEAERCIKVFRLAFPAALLLITALAAYFR